MPCFSDGPVEGTAEYDDWLPEVTSLYDSFAHVVDYYYGKAGFPMPQPHTSENWQTWGRGRQLPDEAVQMPSADDNARVLRQILLHLDCDGISVFQLNKMISLLVNKFLAHQGTPRHAGQVFILQHCFIALRRREI